MLKARILGASLIALSAGTVGAMAADIPMETPTPAPDVSYTPEPEFSWTGFYVGGLVGYEWANIDINRPGDFDTDNFLGGVFTGYNFDVGNGLVLGVEGDVTYHDQKGSDNGIDFGTDWNGTLRGRVGYAMGRFMVYGTGGLALANAEASDPTSSESNTAVGWTAGAGVEAAITHNVFGRVEYRYTDLGSDSYSLDSGKVDADLTSHAIMVGVGVKF